MLAITEKFITTCAFWTSFSVWMTQCRLVVRMRQKGHSSRLFETGSEMVLSPFLEVTESVPLAAS